MPDRQRIRLAVWLKQLWQQQNRTLPESHYEWGLSVSRWECVQLALHRCQLAMKYRLLLCLPGLQQDLLHSLRGLADQINTLRSSYEVVPNQDLSYRHWLEEVEQLYEEFNSVEFQLEKGILRVETPVITLGEICLGAFAIDFKKEGHGLSIQRYEIVALQPEPASTDSTVTHPHVRDGELCAGDAKAPIQAALESGRISDAFLLIQSTLQTYNSRSAYVKLDQWHGISCSDCSRTINPDDIYSCQGCDHQLCDQCFSSCSSCSSTFCPECIRGCSSCNSSYCDACVELSARTDKPLCCNCRMICDRCGKVVSINEIEEEERVCLDCVNQDKEEPLKTNPEEASTT